MTKQHISIDPTTNLLLRTDHYFIWLGMLASLRRIFVLDENRARKQILLPETTGAVPG
jgi:hypothetical protein